MAQRLLVSFGGMGFLAFLLCTLAFTGAMSGCTLGDWSLGGQCDPGYDDMIRSSSSCDGNVLVTTSTSCSRSLSTTRTPCPKGQSCSENYGCVVDCTTDVDCPKGQYCPPESARGSGAAVTWDGRLACTAEHMAGGDCTGDPTHCGLGLVCAPDPQAPRAVAGAVDLSHAVDDAGDGGDDAADGRSPALRCRTLCASADPIALINATRLACITPCTTDADCAPGTFCPPTADAPALADGRQFCRAGLDLRADCTDEPTHCLGDLLCVAGAADAATGRSTCLPDPQQLKTRCLAGAIEVCAGRTREVCQYGGNFVPFIECALGTFCVYDLSGAYFCASSAVPSPLCNDVPSGATCAGTWLITCRNGYVSEYQDCLMSPRRCTNEGGAAVACMP
jgi:hypothetical protein